MFSQMGAYARIAAALMFAAVLVWVGDCDRSASALELSADIKTSWQYSYAAQCGAHGFFGPYNIDNSSTGSNFAPLNGWLGDIMVSGTDAGYSVLTTVITPVLQVNPAVQVKGLYAIGPYQTDTAPGPSAAISTGNWRLWRVATDTNTLSNR